MLAGRIHLNPEALRDNLQVYLKLLGNECHIAGVVKSNAYGHGIVPISQMALQYGAKYLAINSLEEYLVLRKEFPNTILILMGDIPHLNERRHLLNDKDLWIVLSRVQQFEWLASLSPRPELHLKIDTGMGRLGHSGETFREIVADLAQKKIPIDGLATHLASTEDFTEHSYSMEQLRRFEDGVVTLNSFGYRNFKKHAASSASALLFPEARFDFVRIGIAMYGLWPSLETKLSLSLQGISMKLTPVLEWKTQIQHLQSLPEGSFIGYGSTFRTSYPSRIAVIPIGYYEGLDRKLSNNGYMLVKGQRARIVGRICMNMTMLDVTHIPDTQIGETVTIFGEDQGELISPDHHATWTNTINYEVVTRIHPGFPKEITNGKDQA